MRTLRPGPVGLAALWAHLLTKARGQSRPERCDLKGGARLVVQVDDAGVVTVTIGRQGKPVGDVELQTFRVHFQIPPHAQRYPAAGQAQRPDPDKPDEAEPWNVVAFRWQAFGEPEP